MDNDRGKKNFILHPGGGSFIEDSLNLKGRLLIVESNSEDARFTADSIKKLSGGDRLASRKPYV